MAIKHYAISFNLLFIITTGVAQLEKSSEIYKTILKQDTLLFHEGFNNCKVEYLQSLISENFTFYHDQSGVTESKSEFIEGVQYGLCALPYTAIRVLDGNSVNIYPLHRNDTLYGAIQSGEHSFYAIEDHNQKHLTSVAKFTHVWIIENGQWRLQSVLSYDHQDIVKKDGNDGLFIDHQITNEWLKQENIPSVAIGFIDNGRIVQTSVFGQLEKGREAPLNTVWNVASLTKPITALVTLKLVDLGQWNLDEPISQYFKDEDLKADSRYEKITSRIILSHQTGLPNWRGDQGKLKFEFDPGTKYQYSGEGYDLLRKTLESKFSKSIEQLAKELIFEPLDMMSTSFVWSEEIDGKPFAKWHNSESELYESDKFYNANGADNLLTTIEDYSKFVLHILQGAGLSDKLQEEMVADQIRISSLKHFGLGWWIDENINENGDYALVHGGDDIGVHCIAFILPNSKKGLIIFTNSDNGTEAYMEIVNHYLEKDANGIFNAEMN